jgi:predicted MPP superfamily phosphohydrolase
MRQSMIAAPLGAFAVRGNVDTPSLWQRALAGTPVRPIEQTTRLDLGPLVLTCLSLEDSFDTGLRIPAEAKPHIVLGHAPDFAMARPPAELLLAGHTHGGQVRLPGIGPLMTLSRAPRKWADGASEVAPGTLLVTSRGIGMERGGAPRLRFLCRPQVILVDLVPAAASSAPTSNAPTSNDVSPRRSP